MHSKTPSAAPAIQVCGVSKHYSRQTQGLRQVVRLLLGRKQGTADGFQALSPLSFTVKRGETLAIIGRNGAGKSTLLQIICSTLTPSTGTVQVNGRLGALLELGAGFNPDFTGRENIYLSAALYGLTREQIRQRFDAILAFAEIGEHIDHPVKTYSSGMFVRLAFAVIAHIDAEILVIDEALAVGDVYFTQKCMRFLEDFSRRGTLIFVSHDTHTVTRLCQRAIWIDQGQLMLIADSKTVVNKYLASFYEDRLESASAENKADLMPAGSTNNFSSAFGLGGASITSCHLYDEQGERLFKLEQAQRVRLEVRCRAFEHIQQPILGFFIKDRLGQPLCGYNTLKKLDAWHSLAAGDQQTITFSFYLPLLATGTYTITVALAAGTQHEHVQHHWVHDILSFKAQADPDLVGLVTLEQATCSLGFADGSPHSTRQ
ncbi:MAG: ABC transporter ATP-binding protein [Gammaproteobacteria bacterium]|nr:ABC transporter ATP-binding protein [Gammaproteobacteria bacterium]